MIGEITMQIAIDRQVASLTRATASVLEHADLPDSLIALHDRLVLDGRFVSVSTENGVAVVRLKPFAELALLDAIGIARSTSDAATKTRRISETLSLCGY